jgi:hypothetical protein
MTTAYKRKKMLEQIFSNDFKSLAKLANERLYLQTKCFLVEDKESKMKLPDNKSSLLKKISSKFKLKTENLIDLEADELTAIASIPTSTPRTPRDPHEATSH